MLTGALNTHTQTRMITTHKFSTHESMICVVVDVRLYSCMRARMRVFMYSARVRARVCTVTVCARVCTFVCRYVCMNVCMNMYVCMYVGLYVWKRGYIYICTRMYGFIHERMHA